MKAIKIDVDPGDEEEISKIQSWVDRVPEKYIGYLKSIHLLDDMAMDIFAKDLISGHPRSHGITGLFHHDGVIVLRKRKDNDHGFMEGDFYHEIGHLIFLKKDPIEKRQLHNDLFSIWDRYFKHFLRYKDADYQNDEGEIFARIYSHWMLLTTEKAKTLIDLSKIIPQAMESLEKIFG